MEFWRSLVVIELPELLRNIRSFVIELDYGYRYLLEVCSELSDICFLIWLRYHLMFTLHDRPVLATVNISALELH